MNTWTKEEYKNECTKYSMRSEMKSKNKKAYDFGIKTGWLDEFLPKLKKHHPNNYWTKERCIEESKKYPSRVEFYRGCSGGYQASCRNNWIDEFIWLTRNQDLSYYNNDSIYIYKFPELNSVYIGRTIDIKGRHYSHKTDKDDIVYQFITEHKINIPEMEVIETNLTLLEGKEREVYWISFYKSSEWNVINRNKGGSIGALCWVSKTYEECKSLASLCKTKTEFYKIYPVEYKTSLRNNWIQEFFPENKYFSRKVDQLDLEGDYIKTFASIRSASKEIGISESSISSCCTNRSGFNTAGGYKWRYHDSGGTTGLNSEENNISN